jgi:CubicO group peptidase (beta-lactamase class C family)
VQLLSRKTLELMSMNHLPGGRDLASTAQGLFSQAQYAGIGFGLGWATTLDPAAAPWPGTRGDCYWTGMANTFFWCDPRQELACVFMTQLLPSDVYPLQREIRRLVYGALREVAA